MPYEDPQDQDFHTTVVVTLWHLRNLLSLVQETMEFHNGENVPLTRQVVINQLESIRACIVEMEEDGDAGDPEESN